MPEILELPIEKVLEASFKLIANIEHVQQTPEVSIPDIRKLYLARQIVLLGENFSYFRLPNLLLADIQEANAEETRKNVLAENFRVFIEDRNDLLHKYVLERHESNETVWNTANEHIQQDDTGKSKLDILRKKLMAINEKSLVQAGAMCQKEKNIPWDTEPLHGIMDYMVMLIADIDAFEKLLHEHYYIDVKNDETLLIREIIACVRNDPLLPEAINHHIVNTCTILQDFNEAYEDFIEDQENSLEWRSQFKDKSNELVKTLREGTYRHLVSPWDVRRSLAHAIEEDFRLSRQTKNLIHLHKIKEQYLMPFKVFCQTDPNIASAITLAMERKNRKKALRQSLSTTTQTINTSQEADFSRDDQIPLPKRQKQESSSQVGDELPEAEPLSKGHTLS